MTCVYGYETGKVLATINGTKQEIENVFNEMKNNQGTLKDYSKYFTYTLEAEYLTGMHTVRFYAPSGDYSQENVKYGEKYRVPEYWITNINQSVSKRLLGWDIDNDGEIDTFQNCNKLTTITFAENSQVDSIAGVFYGCSSLQSIIIPKNCTQLGYMTFYGCSSLTSIYIPKNVIKQGTNTFINCPNLVIYCEVTEADCQMTDGWNKNSDSTYCTTYYGYSLEQYLSAIGG